MTFPAPPRTWRPRLPDVRLVRRLQTALGVEPLVASMLVNRGLEDAADAERFLNPSVDDLHDPFLLADMDRAADRVAHALVEGETILIYGDADVDGLTGTALLVHFLRALGNTPRLFVPNRAYEGYSFTDAGIAAVLAAGARVVISVDNGVSSVEPIGVLAARGVDVIVTDHHLPGEVLPPACAVVNPRRHDCHYPFQGLAGAGVAFKLACAVASRLRDRGRSPDAMSRLLGETLAWVAMGTVSDVMPLLGENRVLVSRGLAALARTSNPGLRALCAVAGMGPASACRTEDVAFRLAPRLNAASRMDRTDISVSLVTATDPHEAERLATTLDELNRERQAAERDMLADIEPLLGELPEDGPILLSSEHWPTGLLGLVAGRLARQAGRPAVLISSANGSPAKGSCRSVPGFDVHAALASCQQHLTTHGGHRMAAGFSIQPDRIEAFRAAMREAWSERPSESPPLEYEGELPLASLTRRLVDQIDRLEPFGEGNRRPVLGSMGVTILEARRMGGGHHLALQVGQGAAILRAVGFRLGEWADELPRGLVTDVLFTPKLNRFRGRTQVELELVDLRPHEATASSTA